MTMILAISAGELEMIRYAQRSKPRLQHRADEGLGHLDVAYYRRALEEFGYVLRGLDYRSPISVDEILAVFFLMVVYEHQFGRQMSEMEAHLRGLYAFLATLFASNRDLTWTKLPSLSQQLLLFIMYINLNFSEPRYHGSLARLWHEAGHGMSFVSVMDQLFHGSRGGLRNMWMPAYPTEELIDDISVSRPLQFYHECNMLKGRLLLEAYSQSGAPQCQNAWQQELQKLEKRYQDLLEIGRRPDVNMRKHELQAIQFAVAEFHGLAVYTHELLCSDGCQHQGTWHHDTPDETLLVLHRVLRYDKEMAVRIQWPLLVIGKCKPPEVQELLLRESIGEVLGSRGRFQHMGSLYSCDAQRS
ncbi:hypothetical protein O9K51_04901 [Purpureocillium lavendulum]|uniref:Uncharacterized protein n=1 Tax=Purpureocillium lavendulum TaxID=1247861 RepID=A0AB34FQF7_9HYPO|nr:hypothetical protein O9K51_04901 [Purpureocillium lavendulum]